MNLVDTIKGQLSEGALGQLSSILGTGEHATRNAAEAAVPALLSGLTSMASSPGGAQKLISALGKFDGAAPNNLAQSLTDNSKSFFEQGSGLLNSLMGGGMLNGITNALAQFTGLGSGMVQKLMGYLMPAVLGSVAGRFVGKSLNPQSLMSMFNDQKANIANALPSGLSLANVPGLGAAKSAAEAGVHTAQSAGSSALKWLLPIGGLALIALVVWALVRPGATPTLSIPKEGVADVAQISSNLTGTFSSLSQSMAGIKDATSAADSLPKLKELSAKLADVKGLADQLPEAGKTKIHDLVKSNLGKLDDQFAALLWIPGVGNKIKPAVDDIMHSYASLGGLPVPQASTVSGDLAGAFSSFTNTLTGIKDAASAEAAVPKLKNLNEKLDGFKGMLGSLPDAAKSTITPLIKSALASVESTVTQVLANPAASETVKPVVESIMEKLKALAA
jgi:hypothetical protein